MKDKVGRELPHDAELAPTWATSHVFAHVDSGLRLSTTSDGTIGGELLSGFSLMKGQDRDAEGRPVLYSSTSSTSTGQRAKYHSLPSSLSSGAGPWKQLKPGEWQPPTAIETQKKIEKLLGDEAKRQIDSSSHNPQGSSAATTGTTPNRERPLSQIRSHADLYSGGKVPVKAADVLPVNRLSLPFKIDGSFIAAHPTWSRSSLPSGSADSLGTSKRGVQAAVLQAATDRSQSLLKFMPDDFTDASEFSFDTSLKL